MNTLRPVKKNIKYAFWSIQWLPVHGLQDIKSQDTRHLCSHPWNEPSELHALIQLYYEAWFLEHLPGNSFLLHFLLLWVYSSPVLPDLLEIPILIKSHLLMGMCSQPTCPTPQILAPSVCGFCPTPSVCGFHPTPLYSTLTPLPATVSFSSWPMWSSRTLLLINLTLRKR
jgi:hypothetical protein